MLALAFVMSLLAQSPLADLGPSPSVELIDSASKPFALASLRGKVVVVSFVYTTCFGTCPTTTLALSRVQDALKDAGLWGKNVEFVSISLDPARDTPDVLARYAQTFHADLAGWHFLTGPPARVAQVIAAWDMWARVSPSGVLDHPSRIFLLDPRGHQREIYSLEFLNVKTILQDGRSLLPEPPKGDRGE